MPDASFQPCVVHITTPSADIADAVAATLVENRLAACVNIAANITSVYRWQGRIERDGEWLLIVKTRRACLPGIRACLADHHPDDVPECIATDIVDGSPAYLEWLEQETTT